MKRAEIISRLQTFPFDPGEYWVITGGAMVLYGIREETSDIDLGCTTAMADRLEADSLPHQRTSDGKRWFKLDGDVEIFENWLCGSVIMLDHIPVISPQGLREMKQQLGRDKDLRDIQLIDKYISDLVSRETQA